MRLLTEISDPIEREQWSDFVMNHQNGNIFQSPEYYQICLDTLNYSPVLSLCFEGSMIVGVMLGVIQKEGVGLKGVLSSRCIVIGGPLVSDNRFDVLAALLDFHKKQIKGHSIYTQIRNISDNKTYEPVFLKNGFTQEDHLDIHIDLTQPVDEYWGSLKSKLRQNIRKAEKLGVKVEVSNNLSNLDEAYSLLLNVYRKVGLPIPDVSIFQSVSEVSKGKHAIMFNAYYNNKLIGFRIELLYNGRVYDWYAASDEGYSKLFPNDLLSYKVIEWGLNHPQFNLFDFGGAGKPNQHYGVREHKLKFNNQTINLGRYLFVHKPIIYRFMRNAFKLWQMIKSKS